MKKARRALVAGLGAITPAFVADGAQARSVEPAAIELAQSGVAVPVLDQEALKSALLALSPTEKLRIAGDRIRLAKVTKRTTAPQDSTTHSTCKQGACTGVTDAAVYCVQRAKPPPAPVTPQRAR
jgi:hypothetical protein